MFFESIPDDVDAAFVVVLHLDPERQSELPNILPPHPQSRRLGDGRGDTAALSGRTLDAFKTSLRDRLMALARVQGLLSRAAPGNGVAFDELLASELPPQLADEDGDVMLDGPKGVMLRSSFIQALAMALHELTTNAAKHGALGQKIGRLHVRWRVQPKTICPGSLSTGKGSGVQTAQRRDKPVGSGNGRRLIEGALPYQFGSRTTFPIEQDGVHCTIALPLSGPQTEEI
jgi:two-component sensor histidine kinase